MSQISLPHDHGHHPEDMLPQLRCLQEFQDVAQLFHQLSDGNRLRIFWLLCHCEECVINLSAMVEMSSPAVSHHLRQLRLSGLIESRRVGKEVYYRAANSDESRLLHQVIEEIIAVSCPK